MVQMKCVTLTPPDSSSRPHPPRGEAEMHKSGRRPRLLHGDRPLHAAAARHLHALCLHSPDTTTPAQLCHAPRTAAPCRECIAAACRDRALAQTGWRWRPARAIQVLRLPYPKAGRDGNRWRCRQKQRTDEDKGGVGSHRFRSASS